MIACKGTPNRRNLFQSPLGLLLEADEYDLEPLFSCNFCDNRSSQIVLRITFVQASSIATNLKAIPA